MEGSIICERKSQQSEDTCTYATVDAELQILGKGKSLDAGDITNIEEPNVGQNLPFPDIASNDATKDVNLDLDIAGGIHPGKLGLISN